jgi:glutamyl-tRNA reductase
VRICLLGQNHKTAPIELRERLAFTPEKQSRLGELLASDDGIREGVVLSTCNRVELYAVTGDANHNHRRLGSLLEAVHGVALGKWENTLYFHEEDNAIRHLFRVASGLDSMVLGEGQILSQVRDAFVLAKDSQLTREIMNRAFHDALACGKRVRTDTKVGEGAVSVAYAAVSLARKIFKDLSKEPVLLVGAGDTGYRVARHLQLFGVKDLRVTNRSRHRAQTLAEELNASLIPWDNFQDQLSQVGIIVSATSSPQPVITAEMLRAALKAGKRRAIFLIDLAVPRDIEPEVGKIPGAFLYNVDDLQGIVLEGEDQRRLEAVKAESIIDEQVDRFLEWYRARRMTPTLCDLRARLEQMRQAELAGVRPRLDEAAFHELDRVTERLLKKILHGPTIGLKRSAQESDSDLYLRVVRSLFDLDPPSGP